jgi:hypothetical protein
MEVPMPRLLPLVLVLACLAATPAPIAAQPLVGQPTAPVASALARAASPNQVVSANPFGLLIDLFNSEYERRAGDTVSFGIGGSTAKVDTYDYDGVDYRTNYAPVKREERYINGDVFLRYYPSGKALTGRSFGIKVGLTQIPDQGSYLGYGFDLNQSWMLNDHFYFGAGGGLKRLVGTDDDAFDLKYIPTFRLNVGIGF